MARESQKKRTTPAGAIPTRNRPAEIPAEEARIANLAESRFLAPAVCGLLLLAVATVFGQTLGFGFVDFDDNEYVTQNRYVKRGLTTEGIVWAFTTNHAGNWHPITWLSHELDGQLYGLKPWGHHLTNVLLHAAVAILLFLTLRQMTGDLWPSALVAAVFAVHPLRAESVAWVAERKDVLSGLFFMLTLAAYAGYVRRPFFRSTAAPGCAGRSGTAVGGRAPYTTWLLYAAVLFLFSLGLMAKPMLVTLPLVLLLLDYWPLGRMSGWGGGSVSRWGGSCTATPGPAVQLPPQPRFPRPLLIEKLPLFALSIASCVITPIAQGGAVAELESMPLSTRIANAMVSAVNYAVELFYPVGLAVYYPHPGDRLPVWQIFGAAVILACICAAAWIARKNRPYWPVGWFWFLGMLVPVIGLVQVGGQAMADRYTYLPQIGLLIALAWSAKRAVESRRCPAWACAAASTLAVLLLMGCAWRQTSFWRSDEALWSHALECTSRNATAHRIYGTVLQEQGRAGEAVDQYQLALKINPRYVEAHVCLGNLLREHGRPGEAEAHLREALRINFQSLEALSGLGSLLGAQGRFDEAAKLYDQAMRIEPRYVEAVTGYGVLLGAQGRLDDAVAWFEKALNLNPDDGAAYNNLGAVYAKQGRFDAAREQYRKALEIKPNDAMALNNLGAAYYSQGRMAEAVSYYRQAVGANPKSADVRFNLGNALAAEGRFEDAKSEYEAALQAKPDHADARYFLALVLSKQGHWPEAISLWGELLRRSPNDVRTLNQLAWALATSLDASVRDGPKAVELAARATEITGRRHPMTLDTLAAAYAEAGRYAEAVETVQQALALVTGQNNPNAAGFIEGLKARLELYRSGKPYRDALPPGAVEKNEKKHP